MEKPIKQTNQSLGREPQRCRVEDTREKAAQVQGNWMYAACNLGHNFLITCSMIIKIHLNKYCLFHPVIIN